MWLTALIGAVVLACGDGAGGGPAEVTGTGGPGTTGTTGTTGGEPAPTTGATDEMDASTTGDASSGPDTCGFICDSGGTGADGQCDVFAQECPEGEKCAPYADRGGSSWNATKCVPVLGVGRPGEPCTAGSGAVGGIDDCEVGAMCWNVDKMNQGVCVEMCSGSENKPVCDDEAQFNCVTSTEAVVNLCLPHCDPLVQDCPGDDLCLSIGDTCVCVLDLSGDGGQLFGACEFTNSCDKGLLCLNSVAATECDPNAGGCCMPFCDVSDPNVVCPGVGTVCLSLYAEGQAPPEFKNVGICMLPE